MRRIGGAAVLAVACLAGVLASMAPSATAQTGYPPGACSVLAGSQSAGNVTVGQTFTVRVAPTCLFTPGGTAGVVVNGSSAFTKPVNADGTVTLTITVLSTTELSVNPVVPAVCGLNTIRVTGPSSVAGGRQVTQTVTFNLVCQGDVDINICTGGDGGDGGAGLGLLGGQGTGGTGGDGGDACNLTIGADGTSSPTGGNGGAGGAGGIGTPGAPGAPGAPGVAGQIFTPAASTQGRLSRTGSNVTRYAGLAFALLAAGGAMTLAARRRRATFAQGGR